MKHKLLSVIEDRGVPECCTVSNTSLQCGCQIKYGTPG